MALIGSVIAIDRLLNVNDRECNELKEDAKINLLVLLVSQIMPLPNLSKTLINWKN